MASFPTTEQPDEGYSEHPLYSSSLENAVSLAGNDLQDSAAFATWMSSRISSLSVAQKKQLAMALLNELPTTDIQDIVLKQLNPRLFIDFVQQLPAEICLKIFGYLDPVSLINVATCCRGWYNLALDHKLWERLFYLEGWQAVPKEILSAENRVNIAYEKAGDRFGLSIAGTIQPQRLRSSEYGHAHKKRAISDPAHEAQQDAMDLDRDDDTEMAGSGASLFGGAMQPSGSTSSSKTTGSVVQHLGHLIMDSPSPMPVDKKGKGKATQIYESPVPSVVQPELAKSSLWVYDSLSDRYRINWQYLYAMRRRLEYNWEAGKYTNFQLPHPDFPQEGHKECVYSLQYDPDYVVSGSRDKTIRIWNLQTRRLARKPLIGHRGSVLCLQFDADPEEDLIVSGSSDSDVIIWKFSTGEKLQVLNRAHSESVLNVKFDKRILVTCSKDKSIKIFNRRPLRAGELGYGNVDELVGPVPIELKNYGYDETLLGQLPIKPAWTQIGCLEGHGAAVNAVQIYNDEIVSASGDRHIKVWDWPQQICRRTFLGHHKGIACVQYDGRRIISGSSDNEVKVFDRETGLEVATLRGHVNLVRTVQAGFGDLPYSVEEDRKTAKAIDDEYFAAIKNGALDESQRTRGRAPNAGGRRPEDITAYGAKLPPGGGGGPYGRIVSGSYDQTVMIWRRNKEGKWKNVHILQQAEAAANAYRRSKRSSTQAALGSVPSPTHSPGPNGGSSTLPSLHHNARPLARHPAPPAPPASAPPAMQNGANMTHVEHPIHATVTPQTNISYSNMIEESVAEGPAALQHALSCYSTMLVYNSHLQNAIDRVPDAATRSELRMVVSNAVQQAQLQQGRIRESVQQAMTAPMAERSSSQGYAAPAHGAQPNPYPRPSRHPSRSNNGTLSRNPSGRQTLPSAAQLMDSSGPATPMSIAGSPATTIVPGSSAHVSAGPPNNPPHHPQQAQLAQQAQFQGQALNAVSAPPLPPAPMPVHHPHIPQNDQQAPRVFKLQFDAHKIICCSQTSTIVGWDFCNGDPELEAVARFFAPIE
ncbi:F-box/WD repeat-containing protein 1A [Pestalotiopsis sp. NC0098]|nr:F-box/WD repeat-containing protein 1A [Pestalotiopsis sp. NC0098]